MNPLTNVRNVARLNDQDLQNGRFDHKLTWHAQYKDSAYIFIGGLPYDLTEGDVLCVFSQYGEIININLVRDKKTGKFKGYGFLCYEDQRSTILAVDNFNGIKLGGRTIRVDHVGQYRVPKSDEKDESGKYVDKIEMGCAPKTPPPSSGDEAVLEMHPKKMKKNKDKKKKKKKKKEMDFASDGDIEFDQNKEKYKTDNKNHKKRKDVEKEAQDCHYDQTNSKRSKNELSRTSKQSEFHFLSSESRPKSYSHSRMHSRSRSLSPKRRTSRSPTKRNYSPKRRGSPKRKSRSRSPKQRKHQSPESDRQSTKEKNRSTSYESRKRNHDYERRKDK